MNKKCIIELMDEKDIVKAIETVIAITTDDTYLLNNRRSIITHIIYEALQNKKITKPTIIQEIFEVMRLNNANLFDAGYGHIYDFEFITVELSKMMDEAFFDEFYNMFYIDELFMSRQFSEKFIESHLNNLGKNEKVVVSRYQNLSTEFIEKHSKKLDFPSLLIYQQLSANFINQNAKKIRTMLTQKKYSDLTERIKENTRLNDEAKDAFESILLFNKLRE